MPIEAGTAPVQADAATHGAADSGGEAASQDRTDALAKDETAVGEPAHEESADDGDAQETRPKVTLKRRGPAAEEVQQLGRDGVADIKRWLEATTYIEMNLNVYDQPLQCSLQHMKGEKRFDLVGFLLKKRRNPIVVEAKWYSNPGAQAKYFDEFLATAYSVSHKELKERGDYVRRHFYWVTTHPFSQKKWTKLEDVQNMQEAVLSRDDIFPADEALDEALMADVAKRVTVLVLNKKQSKLSLTRDELKMVRTVLKRKDGDLS